MERSPAGETLLHVRNRSAGAARIIVLAAVAADSGVDCSWLLERPTVRRLAPGDVMTIGVGVGRGPRRLVCTVRWVDDGAVPGEWHGTIERTTT